MCACRAFNAFLMASSSGALVSMEPRAVVSHIGEKQDRLNCWLRRLVPRRGMNKAVVALANKNARMAFALIHKDEPYDVTKLCGAEQVKCSGQEARLFEHGVGRIDSPQLPEQRFHSSPCHARGELKS